MLLQVIVPGSRAYEISCSTEGNYCVSYFLSCCEQIPDQMGGRKERRLCFSSRFWVLSIMVSWWEGVAAAGHGVHSQAAEP